MCKFYIFEDDSECFFLGTAGVRLRKVNREVYDLLNKLKSFSADNPGCYRVFCTTCGGRWDAVRRNKSSELIAEVGLVLSKLTFNEFMALGEWGEMLGKINEEAVVSLYIRAAQRVDVTNVRELDLFLLNARWIAKSSPELNLQYQTLLQSGIETAIRTGDNSLVETLIIVLGVDILNYKELLSVALAKREDSHIGRALYNKLREVLPEVRSFSVK